MKKKESKEKPPHDEELSLMMKTFRLALNAPTSTMSEICGLGENGWRIYEKDSSNMAKAQKNIIRFACTPTGFWNLLHMSNLSNKRKEKFMKNISLMLLEMEKEVFEFKSTTNKNYWRRFL
jgi:hypothetical protein